MDGSKRGSGREFQAAARAESGALPRNAIAARARTAACAPAPTALPGASAYAAAPRLAVSYAVRATNDMESVGLISWLLFSAFFR